MTADKSPKVHHGRNVKRHRAWRSMKQEALAEALGTEWSQKKISALEAQEKIEDGLLEKIANVLNIEIEALRDATEEHVVNTNIQNNYEGAQVTSSPINSAPYGTIIQNTIDALVEVVKKNQELNEQLLKEKDEKIQLLQKMINVMKEQK